MEANKHILIVEDQEDFRNALASLLEAAGYEVACAANGQEALDYLQAAEPLSAILLDLSMPTMNGWQFRQAQRQDPALAAIPVILLSGEARLSQTAESFGATAYFPKPIDVGGLIAGIHSQAK